VSFALSLGSVSSPVLSIFSPEGVEEQLGVAGTRYCNDVVEIQIAAGIVVLPHLFEWYYNDFGNNDRELLNFVCRQLTGTKQRALMEATRGGKLPEVQFSPYGVEFSFDLRGIGGAS